MVISGTFKVEREGLSFDDRAMMRIYTHMRNREVIAVLMRDGWLEVVRKGSHAQFKHPTKPGRVTVPHPERDVPTGTLKSIEKQSGLKLR
jgi:predicted RNA binding protein YcfA (HicA-like mRNA interferase family)